MIPAVADARVQPPTSCWECETRTGRLIDTVLGTLSTRPVIVALCARCYRCSYLPLVKETAAPEVEG